jgi:hypothetical protein
MKLKETIEYLSEIKKELGMDIDDKTIFEQACSFVRGELAGKKRENKIEKPTEKQIKTLKKLKIEFPKEISKKEASKLIEEKISSFKK